MLIKVEECHIAAGKRRKPGKCPVALAATEARSSLASVGHMTLTFRGNPNIYVLPLSAREFVKNFDEGLPVEPFSFEIKE